MLGSNTIMFCKDNAFEILLGLCVAFFLIFGLYNKIVGQRGSYSKQTYFIKPNQKHISSFIRQSTNDNNPRKGAPRYSKGEIECRRVLEYLFPGNKFPSSRPDFLRNNVTGGNYNLELDCFNEQLRIAVEYNGIQHYKFSNFFHRNKDQFENQKYRDELKRRMCKENGILLITVPYDVKLENIKSFIETELRRNNIKFRG